MGPTTLLLLLSGPCWAFEVSHSFSRRFSQVAWSRPKAIKLRPSSLLQDEAEELRILHITDSHVSRRDEDPPHTHRMFSAMLNVEDKVTHQPKHPSEQLVELFRRARKEQVDLIALGGDIINYPSASEVSWLLQQLKEAAGGVPFIYTAGNHDWHLEFVDEPRYDSSRLPQLNSTLRPLFGHSTLGADALLYGHRRIKGVDVFFFDNSNHQINEEQLAYARQHLATREAVPAVVLLHMPLALPGVDLPPKELCGHRAWGFASDELAEVEGRPRWPATNLKSTHEFIELVQSHSAPSGRLVALLTGHVHRDFSSDLPLAAQMENVTHLACGADSRGCRMGDIFDRHLKLLSSGLVEDHEPAKAKGALQYSTLDAAEGGFRLLSLRHS